MADYPHPTPPPSTPHQALPPGQSPGYGTAPVTSPSSPSSTSTADVGAKEMIGQFLAQYGLGQLGSWAWSRYQALGGGTDAMNIIQLEVTQTPEFKARFPAIDARAKAGLSPISPADYVNYEQGLNQMMHQYGLPFGANTSQFNGYVTKLLTGDVSLTEAQARVAQGYAQVEAAPQSVRDAFSAYFGVKGDAAIASLYLDPNEALPQLEQMQQAATLGGTGVNFGVNLSKSQAMDLAQHVTTGDGAQQFATVDQMKSLYDANVGEKGDLTQQTGIAAAFGESGQAQDELTRRLQERTAGTAGGGGAASSTAGLIGAGSAPPA